MLDYVQCRWHRWPPGQDWLPHDRRPRIRSDNHRMSPKYLTYTCGKCTDRHAPTACTGTEAREQVSCSILGGKVCLRCVGRDHSHEQALLLCSACCESTDQLYAASALRHLQQADTTWRPSKQLDGDSALGDDRPWHIDADAAHTRRSGCRITRAPRTAAIHWSCIGSPESARSACLQIWVLPLLLGCTLGSREADWISARFLGRSVQISTSFLRHVRHEGAGGVKPLVAILREMSISK